MLGFSVLLYVCSIFMSRYYVYYIYSNIHEGIHIQNEKPPRIFSFQKSPRINTHKNRVIYNKV